MTPGAEIHICTTCPQGRALASAFCAAAPDLVDAVRIFPCLGGCTRRSRASIAAPGLWGWMFGDLKPYDAPDFIAFIRLWCADAEGLVPKHQRPTTLRTAILGRMPPLGSGERFGPPTEFQDHQNPVQQGGTQ